MNYPRVVRLRQHLERPILADIPAGVTSELERLDLGRRIRPGQSVALTAGSRGIANIPVILRSVVTFLKRLGAVPFIVPAMGSHGGATAEGQRDLLHSYGITAEFVGCPIKASMEVIDLGPSPEGYPVYLDKYASTADHIGVVARVKPHTGYHGRIESGLMKMIMIGLGKHVGALAAHRILLEEPYEPVVTSVAGTVLKKAPIAFGLAIVENAADETALVRATLPDQFIATEVELLTVARHLLPKLPIRESDLVIIDEIGKDISGSGMDTNVVGRKRAYREMPTPHDLPRVRRIHIRGLSEKTHGNATGLGMADFTLTRVVEAMDYSATTINCLTAGYPEGAFIPVHFATDREVVDAALKIIGTRTPEQARVIHIRNTLQLEEVIASEACLTDPTRQTTWDVLTEPAPLSFDAAGMLKPV
jgi:hypothetical protein